MRNKHLNLLLEGKIESYWWHFVSDDGYKVIYEFEDDELGYQYQVEFKNKSIGPKLSDEYEMFYYVYEEHTQQWSVSRLTGANIYRVIKTVFGNILSDFLEIESSVKGNALHKKRIKPCNKLKIVGLSKKLERSYKSQRTMVYLRFLIRNPLPGFRLETFGNYINLIRL